MVGVRRALMVSAVCVGQLTAGEVAAQTSSSQTSAGSTIGATSESDTNTDIIVTAQKRKERSLTVPMALTAINTQDAATQGIVQLKDYFTRVPGLNLNGRNSGLSTLAIRGITTGAGTNPTVAITIDDIPYGSSSSAGYGDQISLDLDPSDLARIEVLKGPQGTLYGASSLGGLLKYVTVDPDTTKWSGRAQGDIAAVAHAGDPAYSGRAAINVPLVSDTLAVRLSVYHRYDPGFIKNVLTGETGTNDGHSEGGRIAVLWKPVDAVSVRLAALLQNSSANDASTVDVSNLALQPQFGDYAHSRLPGTDSFANKARLYTGSVNIDLGGAALTSLTGYADNRYSGFSDVTGTFSRFAEQAGSGITFANRFRTKRFTQELRLASSGTHFIDWLVGGFFTHEKSLGLQTFNEVTPSTGAFRELMGFYVYPFRYNEYAGFGDATVHLTSKFNVQVGGRYAHNEQRYSSSSRGPLDGDADNPVQKANGSAFTWLVAPRYQFTPDQMIYARVSSGYRPGGFNSTLAPGVPTSFNPDRTVNYEAGVKGNFFGRLATIEADVFWIDWDKIQLLQRDATGNSFYANGGKARSKGAEAQVTLRPVNGLTIASAVTYTDARLRQDIVPAIYGFRGDRLPYSARWAASASADYLRPLNDQLTMSVGATLSYVGDRLNEFNSRATQPRVHLPGFTTLDLRAGVEVKDWQIQIFAKNVTDKLGYVSGVPRDTIGKLAPYQLNFINPRTVGLSVAKNF